MKAFLSFLTAASISFSASAAEWLTDYSGALAKARESGKLVFIDFTGWDWCPYCIELKKNALSTSEFNSFADQKLILLEVDFPRRKPISRDQLTANRALATRFGIEGYPTLVLVNGDGTILGRVSGSDSPKELIQQINRVSSQGNAPGVAKTKVAPPPTAPMFNGAPTQPPPQYTGLKLQGISGPAGNRLAILNSQTFSKGEGGRVKISGKEVTVRCLEIREKSVLLAIDGSDKEVFGNW